MRLACSYAYCWRSYLTRQLGSEKKRKFARDRVGAAFDHALNLATCDLLPIHYLLPWLPYDAVCRIVSTAAPKVVSFQADANLVPGETEWANYVKVGNLTITNTES